MLYYDTTNGHILYCHFLVTTAMLGNYKRVYGAWHDDLCVRDPGTPKAEVNRRVEFNTNLGYIVRAYLKQQKKLCGLQTKIFKL